MNKIICPKCNTELTHLNNFQSGEQKYQIIADEDEPQWEMQDFIEDGKTNDFECSNCSEILFTNEEDVIAFLKDEDEVLTLIKETAKLEKKNG
jgi:hypothetical protein